jgi:di/tricarboxylate transporter
MTLSIAIVLSVLVLSLVAFVMEWLPVDLTALTIAIVLMVLGLFNPEWGVTPEEGIEGFGNTATITVLAMFILSAGITRTGAVQIFRDLLVRWGGNNAQRQILLMGLIIGPITAFINNTAVVAIFMPIVEDWCRQQKISVSKLLMPLSFVTVLGGMITVIGTSTNVLASGLSKKLGYGEFGLFEFTKLGVVTFILGLTYLVFMAPKLLPDRKPITDKSNLPNDYQLEEYVSEVIITPGSKLIGQTIRASRIQRNFGIGVLELVRDNTHFTQPLADKVLMAGDILIVRGGRSELVKIKQEEGIDFLPDVKFKDEDINTELGSGEEKIGEVLILSNSRLVGTTLKDLRFRQRYNATVLAIRRGEELLEGRLGQIPLRFGDLLLVQGPKESFLGLQTTRELLVIEQQEVETLRRDKAWIALAIILGIIGVSAINLMPILVAAWVGVLLMVITGCLKAGEVYGEVRWDVIFLLAGLIPLGTALEKSGANEWLASHILQFGENLTGYWILLFFYGITALLTEILSNNAAALLMIPVAVEVANALNLNPFAFMFVVTFAASNSYMTPIGYQTNTMVYGPGGYKFLDFTRLGAPLTLMLMVITPLLVIWIYGLQPLPA